MLYMVVDVWSRKIVAARVHERESDELAAALLEEGYHREGVRSGQLGLHSDNGQAMKGQTLLVKLRDLGVTRTFSRPHTSDDNAFSEALFRTMKYRPSYPDGAFITLEAAQAWVDAFVRWHDEDHQHRGIRFVTPVERHEGRDGAILARRRQVCEAARGRAPQRWTRQTRNWTSVAVVCLNPACARQNLAPPSIRGAPGEGVGQVKGGGHRRRARERTLDRPEHFPTIALHEGGEDSDLRATFKAATTLTLTAAVDPFIRRIELGIADGGYVMITGDPGTGKNVALRLLTKRLAAMRDVVVGTIEHPQSRTMDFYRELGDLFGVPLQSHNRWGGFKALHARWADHIVSSLSRPVLVIDEAQETLTTVFIELRVLASKELDSRQLL